MAVLMISEIVDLIRIGDEVEIVFIEEDRTLIMRTVLIEGVSIFNALGAKTRHLWAILDEKKYIIQNEEGVVNIKLIRITFRSHSPRSHKKRFPVPMAPLKPIISEARAAFRPVPRDPRTIGKR